MCFYVGDGWSNRDWERNTKWRRSPLWSVVQTREDAPGSGLEILLKQQTGKCLCVGGGVALVALTVKVRPMCLLPM